MPPIKEIINDALTAETGEFHKLKKAGKVTDEDDDEAILIDVPAIVAYRRLNRKIRGRKKE